MYHGKPESQAVQALTGWSRKLQALQNKFKKCIQSSKVKYASKI